LNDDGSLADAGSTDQLIDLDLRKVGSAKLAVDRPVEERVIAEAMLLLKEEASGPHLLGQERALGAKLTANIPRWMVLLTGIVDYISHAASPQANSGPGQNEQRGCTWWIAERLLSGERRRIPDVQLGQTVRRLSTHQGS
jgi:hypothetical protein